LQLPSQGEYHKQVKAMAYMGLRKGGGGGGGGGGRK